MRKFTKKVRVRITIALLLILVVVSSLGLVTGIGEEDTVGIVGSLIILAITVASLLVIRKEV